MSSYRSPWLATCTQRCAYGRVKSIADDTRYFGWLNQYRIRLGVGDASSSIVLVQMYWIYTSPENRSFRYASFASSSRLDERKRTQAWAANTIGGKGGPAPFSHTRQTW